jgi:starch phosphorylase
LAQANPSLASLIDSRLGPDWRRDLGQLARLRDWADEPQFQQAFAQAKQQNKERLAALIERELGLRVDPHSLFDVQAKRMHEYKRQLLNVLHVINRYHRLLVQPERHTVPRTVVFAGKAASAYYMAKLIIRLINDVARVINNDTRLNGQLRVVFMPKYRVSLAEVIMPAADLSEQISTAGTEASGTGNMKFALNGALTIGTLDGANVELQQNVGADNIFIFGNTAPEVAAIRAAGYQPRAILQRKTELQRVLEAIRDGRFSPEEPTRYTAIYDVLVNWGDQYLLLADYSSYIAAQDRVDALYRTPEVWARKALRNIAGMGPFSSDRTIAEYARDIWRVQPMLLAGCSGHP